MTNTFSVKGFVASYGCGRIIVDEAGTERPVLLTVHDAMMKYIDQVSGDDMEEKYMDRVFIYDVFCTLIAVAVPSKDPKVPAKLVLETRGGRAIRIYGAQELINSRKPEPMSYEDWAAAREYAFDELGFKPGKHL